VNFEEQKWRALCRKAMLENDVNKLLDIFVALDRATEREQRRNRLSKRFESSSESDSEGDSRLK
jgi:hypothetical protein